MSDLRFLKELGAEFERISGAPAGVRGSDRGRWRRLGVPRSAITAVGLGLSVLVVAAVVVAVGVAVHTTRRTGSSVPARGLSITFSATALNPRSPLGPAINRSISILRQRLDTVFHEVHVSRVDNGIVVQVPQAGEADRARIIALTAPTLLEFYDWEANALTPNGKTVASQLAAQDPTALKISQGSANGGPGLPGAGSSSLYEAVKLASKQPVVRSSQAHLSRSGPLYYLFGAPGSAACATVAKANRLTPVRGAHCLLAGPDTSVQNLGSGVPAGVTTADGQVLAVPQGTVVLQATNPSATSQITPNSPSAQFYVLNDNVAVTGADITNPTPAIDSAGRPDVKFGFNSKGEQAFQKVTAAIAHRGQVISPVNPPENQHFAVALDPQLLTVPSIAYQSYPDGITGGTGADITGEFTNHSARALAALLRAGPLLVSLSAR